MFSLNTFLTRDLKKKILSEPVHDGEAILRTGLSPVDKQCPLHLGLLPVLLPSIELVESHLARVSLYGHNVGVNLHNIQVRRKYREGSY